MRNNFITFASVLVHLPIHLVYDDVMETSAGAADVLFLAVPIVLTVGVGLLHWRTQM